ncbi:SemiSWEET family sugar transporter [Hydrogenobaculum acidophilum]
MKINIVELIGFVAGILTTSGYIPQIYTVIKHKNARGLSGLFLLIMGIGISLWLLYGIAKDSLALIFANAFSLFCILVLGFYKIRDFYH